MYFCVLLQSILFSFVMYFLFSSIYPFSSSLFLCFSFNLSPSSPSYVFLLSFILTSSLLYFFVSPSIYPFLFCHVFLFFFFVISLFFLQSIPQFSFVCISFVLHSNLFSFVFLCFSFNLSFSLLSCISFFLLRYIFVFPSIYPPVLLRMYFFSPSIYPFLLRHLSLIVLN